MRSVHIGPSVQDQEDDSPTPASSSSFAGVRKSSFGRSGSMGSESDAGDYDVRRTFDARSFTVDRVCTSTETILSRYAMGTREIGVGGYGKVYMAKDKIFKDREVAIKKMVKCNEDHTQNLVLEVRIMKELDHPNICRLFETYDHDRFMFFVLEYCEGGDLFDRIMVSGKLTEEMTSKVMKQVASALMYAHEKGVAHRDLKPENICFCTTDPESTNIKVIDWGLGKFFQLNSMKSNVGSSTYAAPEVLDAKVGAEGYTSACDLWSLGVVAYISLSGKPPFWGSFHEQIRKMRAEKYPMSSELWMKTSEDGKDFIRRLLKKEPQERMQLVQVMEHPWIETHADRVDVVMLTQVLEKLEQFSHAPDFFSILVASVARQLDFKSLVDVHEVFCRLDTNGDGILDIEEIKAGFETVLGYASEDSHASELEVETMFSRLDLDGTGRLSYTEFCAAGIGEDAFLEEHVLWAAFKIFDVRDDGRITKEEMQEVLSNADVNKVWSKSVCEDVNNIMRLHGNEDGTITFVDWLHLMRKEAGQHSEESVRRRSQSESEILATLNRLSMNSDSPAHSRNPSFMRGRSDVSENDLPDEDVQPEMRKVCVCGNVFMPDAVFCRKCGTRRTSSTFSAADLPTVESLSSGQLPAEKGCFAGLCGNGGCAIS